MKFSKASVHAYEEHHHLVISDEALEAAAHLSSRYVTERFLPDKAIDLIDESWTRVRMYKSEAAKYRKIYSEQLRQTAEPLLAQEQGNGEDVMDLDEREIELGEQIRTSAHRLGPRQQPCCSGRHRGSRLHVDGRAGHAAC